MQFYSLYHKKLNLFRPGSQRVEDDVLIIEDLKDGLLDKQVGERDAKQLREDVELIEGVYHEFDRKPYLDADIAPVFFGSAINNFGVQELL